MAADEQKPEFNKIVLKYKSVEVFAQVAKTTFAKGRMTLKTKKDLAEGERVILTIKFPDVEAAVEIISEVIQKVPAATAEESSTYGVRWLNFTEKKLTKFIESAKNPPAPEPAAELKPTPAAKPTTPPPAPPPVETETAAAPPAVMPPPAVKPKPKAPPPETPSGPAAAPKVAKPPAPKKPKAPPPEAPSGPAATPKIAKPPSPPIPEAPQPPVPSPPPPAKETGPAPDHAKLPLKIEPMEADEEFTISTDTAESAYPSFEAAPEVIVLPAKMPEPEKPKAVKPKIPKAPPPPAPPAPAEEPPEPSPPESPTAPEASGADEIEADTSLDVQPEPPPQPAEPAPEPAAEAPASEPAPGPESAPESATGVADLSSSLPPEAPPPEIEAPEAPAPPEPAPEARGEKEPPPEFAENQSAPEAPGLEETESKPDLDAGSPVPPPEPTLPETANPAPDPTVAEPLPPEPPPPPPPSADAELPPPPAAVDLSDLAAERETEEPEGPAAEEAERAVQRPLSDDELVILGAFLQKLIKLILQPERASGPDAERSLKPLYDEFKDLMSARDEIVIYVRSLGSSREFMVAGDIVGPVNLKNALPPEQFNELAVKLVELFGDKGLAGLQFRKYLTEEAFRQFIIRLGQYDPAKERPEDLAAGLIRDGVFHATPVHESDRIAGAAALDFRVDMTISRLRGELKQLKFLAEAMQEEPAAVWTLRVEDALKTIPEAMLRAKVLLYADAIIAGQEEISAADLAQEIILATPVEMLGQAGEYLASGYEEMFAETNAKKEDEDLKQRLDKYRWVLRQVAARLTVDEPEAATRIMGGLYQRGVFTIEELPPQLRDRVLLEQFIIFFREDPDKRLGDFSNLAALRDYKIAANRYVRMVIELVRSRDVESADRIFRTLVEHARAKTSPFPERPAAAREVLGQFSNPASLTVLAEAIVKAEKDKRDRLAAMIYAAGAGAAGPLCELLVQAEDRSVRRLLCEILTRLGPPVVPALAKRAKDEKAPWFLLRNLVMILGDIGSTVLKKDIERLVRYDHPRVREEGLVYAVKTLGAESEPLMVRALADPEPLVRRRAVRLLTRFTVAGDAAIAGIVKIAEHKPQAEPTADEEQAVEAAAEFLAKLGNRALPGGRNVGAFLIEVLEPESSHGLLGLLTSSKSLRSPRMKASLIEALGKVGDPKAKKVLTNLAKDKDPLVKQSAINALTKIGS